MININPFDIDELRTMELKHGETVGETLAGSRILEVVEKLLKSQESSPRLPVETKIERHGDMCKVARLQLIQQEDGDVCLMIIDKDGSATMEFCQPITGGGKSPKTLEALRNLGLAMIEDNQNQMY